MCHARRSKCQNKVLLVLLLFVVKHSVEPLGAITRTNFVQ